MWDEGKVQQVGAIGTLLLFVLLAITILVVSFGRGAHIQEASAKLLMGFGVINLPISNS